MFDRYAASTEVSWARRAIIVASLVLHGAAAIGLFIYSIFHVEEIAPPAVSLTFFSAPPPPPPPPPPARKKSSTTVEKKVTPTEVVQPTTKLVQPQKVEPKQDDKKDDKDDDDGEEGGQEGGVKGGQTGGQVGGQLGGTVGGTGTDLHAKPASPKMVASFTLTAQQVSHADPHLTDAFKSAHPQQTVKGMYKVCIGTDGHITDVTPMTSIPGMDQTLIEQIKAGWTYKPQPVPVCTASVLVFKIN